MKKSRLRNSRSTEQNNLKKKNGTKKNWPKFLKHARHQLGLKQEALARELGVSQSTVAKWEAGNSVPSIASQKQIYEFYNSKSSERYSDAFLSSFRGWPILGLVTTKASETLAVTKKFTDLFSVEASDIEGHHIAENFEYKSPNLGDVIRKNGFYEGAVSKIEYYNAIRLKGSSDPFIHIIGQSVPYLTSTGILMLSIGEVVEESLVKSLWHHAESTVSSYF